METTSTTEFAVSKSRLSRMYRDANVLNPEVSAGSIETSSSRTATDEPSELTFPPVFERVHRLNEIIAQIRELNAGPVHDEVGRLRPTEYALNRVVELLIASSIEFLADSAPGCSFPKADVSPDLEGGLRIEWTLKTATVTLVVPPQEDGYKEYVCKRVSGKSDIETHLTGYLIAGWLKRFSQ